MILKSLKIQGFKSFADKTMLDFHKGVTAVVGPNGCGKSNIVDAIRWALGETSAKALRGSEMADVIFNGSEKRKPVGMAEVTLTFGDCEEALKLEFNEVAVTRRVFRDGRGEYLLNSRVCRLRDIQELFMDTGVGRAAYSIMEQGKIDQLLSSKPEERRAVFEEAAGITKFKTQKREALRKLEYTDANLLRVRDIIAEVDRQLASAQRQAQKARRYQAIATDARALDLHRCHRERSQFLDKHSKLRDSLRAWKARAVEHETAQEQQEGRLERLRMEIRDAEAVEEEKREKASEIQSSITAARQRSGFNEERNRERAARIEAHKRESAEARDRLTDYENELEKAAGALSGAQAVIAGLRAQETDLRAAAATREGARAEREKILRDARQERRTGEARLSSLEGTRQSLQRQSEADAQRVERLKVESGDFQTEFERLRTEESCQREIVAQAETELARAEEARRNDEAFLQNLSSRRDKAQQEVLMSQKEFSAVRSRLEALRQVGASGEGLKSGAKFALKAFDKDRLRGVLAEKFQVAEEWIPAMEAALGEMSDVIVVDSLTAASAMGDTLRDKKKGRALMLGEDAVLPCSADTAFPAALGAIRAEEPVRSALAHLLKDTVLVEDLPAAREARQKNPALTCVTRAGDRITPAGILLAGAGQGETSTLRRQHEIGQLEKDVVGAEERAKEKEATLIDLSAEIAAARETATNSAARIQDLRKTVAQAQGVASQLHRDIQQRQSRAESLRWETEQIEKRLAEARERLKDLEGEIGAVRNNLERSENLENDLTASLEDAVRDERQARDSQAEARTALALEMRAIEALEERRGLMSGRMEEARSLMERRAHEIATLQRQIEEAERESRGFEENLRLWTEEAETVQATLQAAQEASAARKKSVVEVETALDRHRRELRSVQEHLHKEEVENARVELKLESIAEFVSQRYGVDIDFFQPDESQVLKVLQSQNRMRRQVAKKEAGAQLESEPPEEDEIEPLFTGEADDVIDTATINWEEIAVLAAEMRRRMDAMGPVNLDSIQEFDDLTQRHDFLSRQLEDLVNGKEELLRVIEKINITTRELFEETFTQVRQNFRQTFRELFGQSAQADLSLIDENDPLESGIEITAKPPGKKPSSITLLSGGERSMTAVALLFSIYMVKPSPFCVLDELDAPLDESNIVRFLKMLDRFIEQSQFVIVTHNKRTMSRADILYGVTQEESGVSKLVGINMTGADAEGSRAEMPV